MRTATLSVLFALLLPLLVTLGGCNDKLADEIVEIDKAFDTAIDRHQGDLAASFLSKASLAEFDRVVNLARTADKRALSKEPLNAQANALMARLAFSPEKLRTATGTEFYSELVKKGWTVSTSSQKIQKVKFNNAKTEVVITYVDPPTRDLSEGMYILEDGKWKSDTTILAAADEIRIRRKNKRDNIQDDQLVLFWVSDATSMDVTPDIWDRPR